MSNKKQMVPESQTFINMAQYETCALLGLVPSMDQSLGHDFKEHLNKTIREKNDKERENLVVTGQKIWLNLFLCTK